MKAGIFTVTVEKIAEMGVQDTRHFKLAFDPGAVFDFDAGQFVNVIIPENAEHKALKRAYSIASPPIWKGYLDLCIKKVPGGVGTEYLWTFKEGAKWTVQGPLGRFTAPKPLPKKLVYVSTGTGIAPFRSIIHTLLKEGAQVEIVNIFGNRFVEDILYKEEFEELEKKYPNFKNVFTVSRPKPGQWSGETEYVQNMLKKYVTSPADTMIYICGLTNMINEVNKTALEMGFDKHQVHFEKYDVNPATKPAA